MAKASSKAKAVTTQPERRPVGRPTLYNLDRCDEVIDFMAKGYSLTAYAGSIGVCHETLYEWQRVHRAFSDAVKVAKAARTTVLEEGLLSAEIGPRVTARIFALKNAAPHEWRDRVEHSGPNGGAIAIENRSLIDLDALSPDQRLLFATLLRQALAKPVEQIEGEFRAEEDEG